MAWNGMKSQKGHGRAAVRRVSLNGRREGNGYRHMVHIIGKYVWWNGKKTPTKYDSVSSTVLLWCSSSIGFIFHIHASHGVNTWFSILLLSYTIWMAAAVVVVMVVEVMRMLFFLFIHPSIHRSLAHTNKQWLNSQTLKYSTVLPIYRAVYFTTHTHIHISFICNIWFCSINFLALFHLWI